MGAGAERLYWQQVGTPIGELLLVADRQGLREVCFQSGPRPRPPEDGWVADPGPLRAARAQLEEYFAGRRRHFELELRPTGTAFQLAVWAALRAIPYGTTLSYAQFASRIGNPRATRAVGLANGANPLPIIVPCHRVIGSDGSLTGFGGGLPIKRQLLALEGVALEPDRAQTAFQF